MISLLWIFFRNGSDIEMCIKGKANKILILFKSIYFYWCLFKVCKLHPSLSIMFLIIFNYSPNYQQLPTSWSGKAGFFRAFSLKFNSNLLSSIQQLLHWQDTPLLISHDCFKSHGLHPVLQWSDLVPIKK